MALLKADDDYVRTGVLYAQGNYSEAISLAREVLKVRKRLLGKSGLRLSLALNLLALLYKAQGDYARAEPLYRQAGHQEEGRRGEPSRLCHKPDLPGPLYVEQGDYARAEPLYRQAMEIQKRILGENHPDYATSLNGLAALYEPQGDYAQAEPLYRQALEIRKKALGENHPDYATSLNNLASAVHRNKATTRGPNRFSVRPWRSRRRSLGRTTPIMLAAWIIWPSCTSTKATTCGPNRFSVRP